MRRFLIWLCLAAAAFGLTGTAGPYRVELTVDPAVVPVGPAELVIRVRDSAGNPVEGATVKALAKMPGMDMGERDQTGRATGEPGVYRVGAAFSMAGGYQVLVTVQGKGGEGTVTFDLTTGQSTATASGPPWHLILGGVGLVALLGIGYALHRGGHLPSWRTVANRQVIGGLLLLALMAAGAVYAVRHFRRPGAMTPIEAQVMEMNMPAPPGTLAVETVTVRRGKIESSVSYAGQAVAYQEQPLYPRTEGIIEWMPFYVGDRVSKGEVVARLDVSQLEPEQLEREADAREAREAVEVARAEQDQAKGEVDLAEAERSEKEAGVKTALARLDQAEAQVKSARAEALVKRGELRRSRVLAEAGGLSQEELQQDEAEAEAAEQKLSEGFSEVEAARAEVQAARSQVEAHHAHVESVEAAHETRRRQVRQATASASGAEARLRGSEARLGYAEVRSSLDGVVSARRISPGVLVQPGTAILDVAQINPIRLQANVSEADLSRVSEGDLVRVTDARGRVVETRVTSVSPAVNAATRQGAVEAVVPNRDHRFLPGNLIRLEIVTAARKEALFVPTAAIQEHAEDRWVWVARPEGSGYVAHRAPIEVGISNGETTGVRSGLEEGQLVITSGATGLRENDPVTIAGPAAAESEAPTVRVTERGFEPASLTLPAGEKAQVTFLRTTDKTCGTEVVFPELKLRKELPLNKPVTIELPAHAGHTLKFQCGMDMLRGTVVVR